MNLAIRFQGIHNHHDHVPKQPASNSAKVSDPDPNKRGKIVYEAVLKKRRRDGQEENVGRKKAAIEEKRKQRGEEQEGAATDELRVETRDAEDDDTDEENE